MNGLDLEISIPSSCWSEDISDASLFNARNPEFNLDVLSRIMGVSNRLILSSLMKTCHVYYSIGVPSLLRFSVEIGRFESIEPFHEFMFSTVLGSRDSFRFLQDLTLYGGCHHPRSPKAVYSSLHIISHSIYLECLRLDSDDANLLFYPHHFYHGISALGYLIALQKIVVCGSWMPLDWLRQLPFRRFTHSHGTATFYSVLRFNDVVALTMNPSGAVTGWVARNCCHCPRSTHSKKTVYGVQHAPRSILIVPKLAEQPDFQIEIQHPAVFQSLAL